MKYIAKYSLPQSCPHCDVSYTITVNLSRLVYLTATFRLFNLEKRHRNELTHFIRASTAGPDGLV